MTIPYIRVVLAKLLQNDCQSLPHLEVLLLAFLLAEMVDHVRPEFSAVDIFPNGFFQARWQFKLIEFLVEQGALVVLCELQPGHLPFFWTEEHLLL